MKISQKIIDIVSRFSSDSKKEKYVREIARETGMSTSTAFRLLKTMSQNNLLHEKRRGKELLFSLNSENKTVAKLCELVEVMKTEEFFKKERRLKIILSDVQRCVVDKLKNDVVSLVIFGSIAKSTFTKESDIDLLIITQTREEMYKKWKREIDEICNSIRVQYGRDLSTVFISLEEFREKMEKKEPFVTDIINHHLVIYGFEPFVMEMLK